MPPSSTASAPRLRKPAAGLEEGAALLVGDAADARHVAVALLDALELVAFGGDDLGLGDLAVEPARP